jgi:hypothetical protein
MKRLFIVHGISQVGKSEISRYLQRRFPGIVEIHPIASWKRLHEEIYGLEVGSLDTKAGKEYIPNGMNCSMNDLMVRLYFMMKEVDPYYSSRSIDMEVSKTNAPGIVLLSLRNHAEVDIALKHSKSMNTMYLHVTRDGVEPISSDLHHDEIHQRLSSELKCQEVVNNYLTLRELHKELNKLCY